MCKYNCGKVPNGWLCRIHAPGRWQYKHYSSMFASKIELFQAQIMNCCTRLNLVLPSLIRDSSNWRTRRDQIFGISWGLVLALGYCTRITNTNRVWFAGCLLACWISYLVQGLLLTKNSWWSRSLSQLTWIYILHNLHICRGVASVVPTNQHLPLSRSIQ